METVVDKLLIHCRDLEWEIETPPGSKIVVGNREGMNVLIGEPEADGREFFSLQRVGSTWGFELNVSENEKVLIDSRFVSIGLFYLPLRMELPDHNLVLELSRKPSLPPLPIKKLPPLPRPPDLPEAENALHPGGLELPAIRGKGADSELPPMPDSKPVAGLPALPERRVPLRWVYPAMAIVLIFALALVALLAGKLDFGAGLGESTVEIARQPPASTVAEATRPAKRQESKESLVEELLSVAKKLEDAGKPAEALEKYKAAALEGSAEGANAAGVLIMQSEGNAAEAFKLFEEAARNNHARANYNAGLCLKDGLGVSADPGRAFEYFQNSAELGNPEAMNALGMAFLEGAGTKSDSAKALEWFQRAEERGVPSAMGNLGTMYARAQGVPKNLDKAREWYQKAIDAGDSAARENLEILAASDEENLETPQTAAPSRQNSEDSPPCSEDNPGEGESNKVLTLNAAFEKANAGDAYAQAVLSFYYGLGYKTEKNTELSAEYAMKSASQGHPLGVYRLGTMRQTGEGMEKNEAQGQALKAKAFDGLNNMGGDPYAITALGVMLFRGEGVARNRSEAARLYRLAADMGYAPAQFNYSACLMAGQGVQKNPEAAQAYWRAAFNQSYPPAMSGPPQ
jgi:TPR repeat protein